MLDQAVIDQEIARLIAIKPSVRKTNVFGADHHAAIDAQVEVLRGKMREPQIYERWGDEDDPDFADNVLEEALNAAMWMLDTSDEAPPSENWADLVI